MADTRTTLPSTMSASVPEQVICSWKFYGAKERRSTRSFCGKVMWWRSEDVHLHGIGRQKLNGNHIEARAPTSQTTRQLGAFPSAAPITTEDLRDDRNGEALPGIETTTRAISVVLTKHGRAELFSQRLPIDWDR